MPSLFLPFEFLDLFTPNKPYDPEKAKLEANERHAKDKASPQEIEEMLDHKNRASLPENRREWNYGRITRSRAG